MKIQLDTVPYKLWTAVYLSRMAPIGAKLGQNAFQTIPDISFFDAKNQKKCRTLNGRLPLEYGSVRPQTLGKCVSDDPRHFIFRRRKKLTNIFVEQIFFVGKISNLPVLGWHHVLEKWPPRFWFSELYDSWQRVKMVQRIFGHDFWPNMTFTKKKWFTKLQSYDIL